MTKTKLVFGVACWWVPLLQRARLAIALRRSYLMPWKIVIALDGGEVRRVSPKELMTREPGDFV